MSDFSICLGLKETALPAPCSIASTTYTHSYPRGIIQSHPLKSQLKRKGRHTHGWGWGRGRSEAGRQAGHHLDLELRGCSRLLGEFRPFHPEGLSRVGVKKVGCDRLPENRNHKSLNHSNNDGLSLTLSCYMNPNLFGFA